MSSPLTVLTSPGRFFADRSADRSPVGPLLVVGLAIVKAIGPLVQWVSLSTGMSGGGAGPAALGGVIGGVFAFVGMFVIWAL